MNAYPAATLIAAALALGAPLGVAAAPQRAAPSPAAATDPARGGKLFLQCAACHTIQPGAPNRVGPNLSGIVGGKAATRAGYTYSPAMAASGRVWTTANLDAFLKRPSQAVPGTKMAFGGVADAQARADIIAYLALNGKK